MLQTLIQEVDVDVVQKRKKSDTIFIFGSGYSINDLSSLEIEKMEEHDTLSFSWFIYQNFIHADYHLIREVARNDWNPAIWRPEIQFYGELLKGNPFYQNALFVLQVSINSLRLVSNHCLPEGAEYIFYHSCPKGTKYPNEDFKSRSGGLVHGPSTLFDCINFAYLFGWQKIVLVGIDLYDSRYFWLKPDQSRPGDAERKINYMDQHNTAYETVIWVRRWGKYFQKRIIELFVYHPKSLLTRVLPIFGGL